jgi:hypothetical protein
MFHPGKVQEIVTWIIGVLMVAGMATGIIISDTTTRNHQKEICHSMRTDKVIDLYQNFPDYCSQY